jgi:hypothetical protein
MSDPAAMTDHERYFLDLNGYILLEGVLSPATVERLNEEIDAQELAQPTDDIWSQRFGGFFMWNQVFRDLIDNERVLGVTLEMMGDKLRLDHAYGILMGKGNVGLHLHGQSTPYDPSQYYIHRNGRMYNGLTVVSFALSDVGPADGGFCCVPGSHKSNYRLPDDVRNFEAHREWVCQPPHKAGDVVIFTEALTHGTLPWQGDQHRRSLLLKYAPSHLAWGKTQGVPEALDPLLTDRQRRLLQPPYQHGRERILDDAGD